MSKSLQIYYNAIFGAFGGLLAWWLVGLFPTAEWNLWLATAFIGAGAGAFIGAAVGAVDGAVTKRSPGRALAGLFFGGIAGLVSGVLGLFIGQAGFLITGGGFTGRTIGWTAFGLFLGIGESIVEIKQVKRAVYSAVGGTVAGIVGGLIYEGVTQAFLQNSEKAQVVLGAVGLSLIGACLGGITALTVGILAGKGLLVVRGGSRAGNEIQILDQVRLGSYDGCEVYLPGGQGVERVHAIVAKRRDGFYVEPRAPVLVRGQAVPQGGQKLQPGDTMTIGSIPVSFEAR